ncbi:hypothetical protein P8C59_008563 [Phyllachora maydis]|uniref:Velvet domain-containing protein n=1 Tax=Phyllachora maydis TaxID=1825666 RepID=A0AAD9IBN1_9PEZI|nr:hypothetical protein P8C59_008563 [Phyllachora maydis]
MAQSSQFPESYEPRSQSAPFALGPSSSYPPHQHRAASSSNPLSIANLVSDCQRLDYDRERHAQAVALAATPNNPPDSPFEYMIEVRQQPKAARSCGFGERDRRVIDPPPILVLTARDKASGELLTAERLSSAQCAVVNCTIWDEAGTQDLSLMPEDFRRQRRLMGTLAASVFLGRDERGEAGCFFQFSDLSCRTAGRYRLRFDLVVPDPSAARKIGQQCPFRCTTYSDPFQVYNAKDFPGMQASTPLTKRLKEQGCLISLKKGNKASRATRQRGAQSVSDESDSGSEDDLEDDEHTRGKGSRKRRKPSRSENIPSSSLSTWLL